MQGMVHLLLMGFRSGRLGIPGENDPQPQKVGRCFSTGGRARVVDAISMFSCDPGALPDGHEQVNSGVTWTWQGARFRCRTFIQAWSATRPGLFLTEILGRTGPHFRHWADDAGGAGLLSCGRLVFGHPVYPGRYLMEEW